MKGKALIAIGILAAGLAACTTGEITTWRGVQYKKLPAGLCAADGSPVAWQKQNADGTFAEPKNINAENCK